MTVRHRSYCRTTPPHSPSGRHDPHPRPRRRIARHRRPRACLTGASTLGDQRALATLRTDTEDACPCEAATSRASWRKCARTQLAAVVGAALRTECEKTAKQVIKGATCGTTKTACGRVQPE